MKGHTMRDHSRTDATQPYRATQDAQTIARRLTVTDDGRTVTLRPLADVLTARTKATLAAFRKTVRRG
jgi:hypothetical protein